MMLQSKNLGCRLWLIPNKVVKDLRRLLVVIFQLMLFICLSGCENNIEYQEVTDTEEYAVSDQQERDDQEVMETETYTVSNQQEKDDQEAFEKGYNLPILQSDINQAEKETDELLDYIEDMYRPYLDDEAMIPEDVQEEMADVLADKGYIIRTDRVYSNIRNEELFERFLTDARNGKQGSVILYELEAAAAVDRYEYEFDGVNMYLYSSRMEIKLDGSRSQTYCSCTRIKSWRYTEAGWFCYKLCVPEYPEVTEIVDGSVLIRVKPMSEENRQASEKYVMGIGYQGNNILCSNWDADCLDTLDYTGMYEYLYAMDTGERFCLDGETEGIPADEFETLIMKYIPTSREIIRKNSAYDIENGVYNWVRLSCLNYTPTYFGTSYPEVIDIKENTDGTITLTVNAVCEMVLNDEAIITHELIIKENSDGSFMYMGNKILDDGINNIPDYEYRIRSSYCDDSDDM